MPARALVRVGAALNLALAGVAGALILAGDDPRPRDAADWLRSLAFFAVWALPALLALPGERRPEFLLAAAGLALLLVPTTFSLSLLLLVPALLYVVALAGTEGRATWRGALPALAAVVIGAGAAATLTGLTEGHCWEYEIRADGTATSRTVPTEGRWEHTDGGVGGSSGTHVLGGDDVVEAGGGCEDRTTATGAAVALVLVAGAAGAAVSGARLHSSP